MSRNLFAFGWQVKSDKQILSFYIGSKVGCPATLQGPNTIKLNWILEQERLLSSRRHLKTRCKHCTHTCKACTAFNNVETPARNLFIDYLKYFFSVPLPGNEKKSFHQSINCFSLSGHGRTQFRIWAVIALSLGTLTGFGVKFYWLDRPEFLIIPKAWWSCLFRIYSKTKQLDDDFSLILRWDPWVEILLCGHQEVGSNRAR